MMKRYKIFFIAVLALLVVGMVIFGVFGFNKTIDNRNSYEMQIEVKNVGEDAELFRTSAKNALKENGLNPVSVQYLDDGDLIIYKFNKNVESKADAVKADVESGLSKATISGLTATVAVKEVVGGYLSQIGKVLLALGLSLLVVFIYALIVEKLSGGVAVGCSTVLSALLATSLIGLTRIPAGINLGIYIAISMLMGGAVSAMLSAKYRAGMKSAERVKPAELVEKVYFSMTKSYIVVAGALLVMTLLSLIGGVSLFLMGLGVLLSALSGLASAIYMTPFMWALIKGRKK